MGRYKYFACLFLWMFMPLSSMAVDFELSDVIREARETELHLVDKSQIQQNAEQTKNELSAQSQIQGEKSAIEKLKPDEITK